jgi:hypothetical protein
MEKLSEAARIIKNNYLKQWRRDHPEKVKGHNIAYWERKVENNPENVTVTDTVTDNVTVTDKGNKCIECGLLFQAKRSDTKFCSHACKQKFHRKKQR